MSSWFNERKSAQIAAFFCEKEGGSIPVLKLVKLIYLSDRESMRQTGFPITNDELVSMPHGPVNSMTLNFIDGNSESERWSDLITDKANYMVGLTRKRADNDVDELSELDVDVLEAVWKQFGSMTKYAIRDWTHANCPEWEDPRGSCNPIPHERILKYLGVEAADELAAEIAEDRFVDSVFSSLRA
mgnify:FL=1|tara:strand:+ start:515 stop:1072 length:558 start_codon:yes stop_codon:yes gene_type:complete